MGRKSFCDGSRLASREGTWAQNHKSDGSGMPHMHTLYTDHEPYELAKSLHPMHLRTLTRTAHPAGSHSPVTNHGLVTRNEGNIRMLPRALGVSRELFSASQG